MTVLGECASILLRDLGTHASAIRYARKIAAKAEQALSPLAAEYAEAANQLEQDSADRAQVMSFTERGLL
jgi:hypothetical protein